MSDAEPPFIFEKALAELDQVLRDLEDGTTSLEDALTRYEKGVGLLKQCYAKLRDAELRIQQLGGLTPDGSPDLKSFSHTASVEKVRPPARKPKSQEGTDNPPPY
jgi:exodeoxyribonuclease VII small subunit